MKFLYIFSMLLSSLVWASPACHGEFLLNNEIISLKLDKKDNPKSKKEARFFELRKDINLEFTHWKWDKKINNGAITIPGGASETFFAKIILPSKKVIKLMFEGSDFEYFTIIQLSKNNTKPERPKELEIGHLSCDSPLFHIVPGWSLAKSYKRYPPYYTK